ncbi:hypothetical protein KF201_0345 [Lactococcus lactis subsp. lactis]|uniref:Uncharacterized protein n=1 Tax=Lactococcus lactis subsp. lactis TaxID=1360 RepID=A0A0V8E1H7_LACLL|nr:hypothetical protein Llab_1630 [Lactococcus lactis]KSU03957.1 hypothetical protein KF201_0345 [Lactococcus lactis subsp. lactis]KSU19709.1 hypothetical protein M20_1949 [Lactococcus lactis subsp. lactis]
MEIFSSATNSFENLLTESLFERICQILAKLSVKITDSFYPYNN